MVKRAKKKKKKEYYNGHIPDKPEQKRIMEANWLCIDDAWEQLYSECGWRDKRRSNLIIAFWHEMTDARKRQNEMGINNMPYVVAAEASEWIGEDIPELLKGMDKYRQECYMLCLGNLVKALKKLKVRKTRVKLIIGEIIYDQQHYELWSVHKYNKSITGFDVKEEILWD